MPDRSFLDRLRSTPDAEPVREAGELDSLGLYQAVNRLIGEEICRGAGAGLSIQAISDLGRFIAEINRHPAQKLDTLYGIEVSTDPQARQVILEILRPSVRRERLKEEVLSLSDISKIRRWGSDDGIKITSLTVYNTELPSLWLIRRNGIFGESENQYEQWFLIGANGLNVSQDQGAEGNNLLVRLKRSLSSTSP